MDDLISRQAAIDALVCQEHRYKIPGKRETYSQYNEGWQDALGRAEGVIGDLPSAQPEIIRCKDCKWWSNDDYRECSSPNYDDGYVTPAGFYCGYAERRTDGRD